MKHSLKGRFSWRDIADYLPADFTEGSIDQHLEKDRIKTMTEAGIVPKNTQRTKSQQKEDIRALALANQSKVGRKKTIVRSKKPARGRGRRRAKTPPSSSSGTLPALLPAPPHIKDSPKSPPSVFAVPPVPTRVLRSRPARGALPPAPQPPPAPRPVLRPAQPLSLAPTPPAHSPHGLYSAWEVPQVPQAPQATMGSMDTDPYYQQQQSQDMGFGGYGMEVAGVPQAQEWDESFGAGMGLVAESLLNNNGMTGLGIDFEGLGRVPDSAVDLDEGHKMDYGWPYGSMGMATGQMGHGQQQQFVQPQALQMRYSDSMSMGWN